MFVPIFYLLFTGDPVPSVVWRRNGIEVKNGGRYTLYPKKRSEGIHLVLDIGRLTRDELKASFTCEATNRIVDKSLSSTVTIDLIRESDRSEYNRSQCEVLLQIQIFYHIQAVLGQRSIDDFPGALRQLRFDELEAKSTENDWHAFADSAPTERGIRSARSARRESFKSLRAISDQE